MTFALPPSPLPPPPPPGLTPAHVATKEASIDVLKFLFQMGANKNAPVS